MNHLLDVENLVLDVIHHISQRLVLLAVIDCGDHVVIVPAPIFMPGQLIANHGAMTLHNEVFVHIFQIFVLQIHTLHHSRHRMPVRQLCILNGESQLV